MVAVQPLLISRGVGADGQRRVLELLRENTALGTLHRLGGAPIPDLRTAAQQAAKAQSFVESIVASSEGGLPSFSSVAGLKDVASESAYAVGEDSVSADSKARGRKSSLPSDRVHAWRSPDKNTPPAKKDDPPAFATLQGPPLGGLAILERQLRKPPCRRWLAA